MGISWDVASGGVSVRFGTPRGWSCGADLVGCVFANPFLVVKYIHVAQELVRVSAQELGRGCGDLCWFHCGLRGGIAPSVLGLSFSLMSSSSMTQA